MQTMVTGCTKGLADLLPLMPRGVDLVWHRGPIPSQYDEAGTELPKPVLHFALPLDASGRAEARAFLKTHLPMSPAIAWTRGGEGVLMIGLDSDGLAKHIAREELLRDVLEGLFGCLPEGRKAGFGPVLGPGGLNFSGAPRNQEYLLTQPKTAVSDARPQTTETVTEVLWSIVVDGDCGRPLPHNGSARSAIESCATDGDKRFA